MLVSCCAKVRKACWRFECCHQLELPSHTENYHWNPGGCNMYLAKWMWSFVWSHARRLISSAPWKGWWGWLPAMKRRQQEFSVVSQTVLYTGWLACTFRVMYSCFHFTLSFHPRLLMIFGNLLLIIDDEKVSFFLAYVIRMNEFLKKSWKVFQVYSDSMQWSKPSVAFSDSINQQSLFICRNSIAVIFE